MQDTVVFTFGRFQPPGKNHARVIDKMASIAFECEADHVVFLSQTQNAKNPLDWAFKVQVCQLAFPDVNFDTNAAIKTPFQALESLALLYKNIVLVVGNDRVLDFTDRMTPYVTKWGIDTFKVVSAGARTGRGAANLSGTKLREYALTDNLPKLFDGLAGNLLPSTKYSIYEKIKESQFTK